MAQNSIPLNDLFREVLGDTWQDKLNTLSLCNCCVRHQINKPSFFSTWIETPYTGNNNHICNCNCRHIARHICRQTSDYPGLPSRPISPNTILP